MTYKRISWDHEELDEYTLEKHRDINVKSRLGDLWLIKTSYRRLYAFVPTVKLSESEMFMVEIYGDKFEIDIITNTFRIARFRISDFLRCKL